MNSMSILLQGLRALAAVALCLPTASTLAFASVDPATVTDQRVILPSGEILLPDGVGLYSDGLQSGVLRLSVSVPWLSSQGVPPEDFDSTYRYNVPGEPSLSWWLDPTQGVIDAKLRAFLPAQQSIIVTVDIPVNEWVGLYDYSTHRLPASLTSLEFVIGPEGQVELDPVTLQPLGHTAGGAVDVGAYYPDVYALLAAPAVGVHAPEICALACRSASLLPGVFTVQVQSTGSGVIELVDGSGQSQSSLDFALDAGDPEAYFSIRGVGPGFFTLQVLDSAGGIVFESSDIRVDDRKPLTLEGGDVQGDYPHGKSFQEVANDQEGGSGVWDPTDEPGEDMWTYTPNHPSALTFFIYKTCRRPFAYHANRTRRNVCGDCIYGMNPPEPTCEQPDVTANQGVLFLYTRAFCRAAGLTDTCRYKGEREFIVDPFIAKDMQLYTCSITASLGLTIGPKGSPVQAGVSVSFSKYCCEYEKDANFPQMILILKDCE